MPFGLLASLACHAALLVWAFWSMRAVQELPSPDTPAISAEIITPSEFLRLKQGSEDAKKLETKANDTPTTDDSKNDTKKPDDAAAPPPPPPQEVAKAEPPPPPEPPKVVPEPPKPPEPVKPPEPDPIAKKIDEPPPPPEPAPGPTPDEQKQLEQKIEEQRKADEAKQKAEEEAKKKAEEEAHKKKLAEEAKKKKLAEEARKKKLAEEAKKKFDASKLANLIEKAPDDAQPKVLIDKDPRKKGQQAAGTSQTATALGKEAGTATGQDTVLSAREQDLLKGLIKSQLAQCWRLPGAGGGTEIPVVTLRWRLRPDGGLDGEPVVKSAPNDTLGNAAAEAALRAVRGCQPFQLPPESYEGWKDIEWVFDPRQML